MHNKINFSLYLIKYASFATCSKLNNNINSKNSRVFINKHNIVPLFIYSCSEKDLAIKENKGKSGVYRWVYISTGESYIGSAVDLSKRFSVYYSQKSIQAVLSRSKSNILSAMQKYGYSDFYLEILEYCDSSQTIDREQYYLDLLSPEYNILPFASSSLGKLHTEETKIKISESLTGKYHSEETKQKMTESRKGKIFSDKTKQKLSELRLGKDSPFLGLTHSEETKLKMSESLGSKVEVVNIETNETIIYPSNYKAAKAIGCSESTIRYCLKKNKSYKNKYTFNKSN
jgi:group I intron endonuclease